MLDSPLPDSDRTAPATPDQLRRSAELSTQASAVPDIVGERYELQGLLAKGGMGSVHKAWDGVFKRTVAIKLIHDHVANDHSIKRFQHESLISAQLQHPNIPPVYDQGIYGEGRPFIAMKLVKGRTLDDHIKHAGPDTPNLIAVFEAVCHALGYAHSRGVIHRDLKPLNVMVGAFGEVQVMDWGLAKFRQDADDTSLETSVASTFYDPRRANDSRTGAGSVLGTPAYMPPEQAIGAIGEITERSDVVGLGAILCAILTGRPVFVGADSESTRQMAAKGKVGEAFARLDAAGSEPELVALAKRCLAVEPNERWANGTEVAHEVARIRAAADERARQAELARLRIVEERKRRRLWLGLAGVSLALVAVVAAAAWWLDRRTAIERAAIAARESEDRQAVDLAFAAAETALGRENISYPEVDTALIQAERRLGEAGPLDQKERLARLRADLSVVKKLDRLMEESWTKLDFANGERENQAKEMREAFAEYGMDLAKTTPDQFAAHFARTPIRDILRDRLDGLFVLNWPNADRSLLPVLKAVDPDPLRNELRMLLARGGRALSDARPRLRQIDPNRITTPLLASIRSSVMSKEWGEEILERRANSYELLASYLNRPGPSDPSKSFALREKYLLAMCSLRPDTAFVHVRVSFMKAGSNPENALFHAREAVRLAPDWYPSHACLTEVLVQLGRFDEAWDAYRHELKVAKGQNLNDGCWSLAVSLAKAYHNDSARASETFRSLIQPYLSRISEETLGHSFGHFRDVDRAAFHFRHAIAMERSPGAISNAVGSLARMLAENGRREESAATILEYLPKIQNPEIQILQMADYLRLATEAGLGKRAEAEFAKFIESRTNPRDRSNAWLTFGQELLHGRRDEEALRAHEESTRADPSNENALGCTAALLHSRNRLAEAEKLLRKVATPDNWQRRYFDARLGILLLDRQKYDEALSLLNRAMEPKDDMTLPLGAYLALAHLHVQAGRLKEAEAVLKECRDEHFNPTHHSETANGYLLLAQNRTSEAEARFRNGVRLQADYEKSNSRGRLYGFYETYHAETNPHYGLARCLSLRGNATEALAIVRIALKSDPAPVRGRTVLGEILAANGQLPEALAELQAATELDPTLWEPHAGLARVYGLRNEPLLAVAAFERSLELNPKRMQSYFDFAQFHRDRRAWGEAEKVYRLAAAADPNSIPILRQMGTMLWEEKKDLPGAIAAFTRWRDLDPKDAGAHNDLGCVLRDRGRTAEAIVSFERAAALDPRYGYPPTNLGWIYLTDKKFDRALNYFESATAIDPNHHRAWMGLAQTLLLTDRPDKALFALTRCVELRPDHLESNNLLALVHSKRGHYVSALGVYRTLIEKHPGMAADPRTAIRYNAACCAVLTAFGEKGSDGKMLLDEAYAWIEADLAAWRRRLPKDAESLRATTSFWLSDSDLALVRDAQLVSWTMQMENRPKWQKLWQSVYALSKVASTAVLKPE